MAGCKSEPNLGHSREMEKEFKVRALVRERPDWGMLRQHLPETSFTGEMRVDKCHILLALEEYEV